jgi:hypothetical protein
VPARIGGASGRHDDPDSRARAERAPRRRRVEAARAVAGVDDVVISVRVGETLVPLPEGSSYTGFIFATGDDPISVEQSLRDAHARLRFTVAPLVPVARDARLRRRAKNNRPDFSRAAHCGIGARAWGAYVA